MLRYLILGLSTLASEDLTCISAGLLSRAGELSLPFAMLACFVGIVVGDQVLWSLGWLASHGWIKLRTVTNLSTPSARGNFERLLAGRGFPALILITRFLPGTRTAFYLTCGFCRVPFWRFTRACAFAGLLWTPFLVGLTYFLGTPFKILLEQYFEKGPRAIAAVVALAVICVLVLRWVQKKMRKNAASSPEFKFDLSARLERMLRYEYWPASVFYLPLVPWCLFLAIRYRGLFSPLSVNPSMPLGGMVGESKSDILSRLNPQSICRFFMEPALHSPQERFENIIRELKMREWNFPVVLKPDAGQRGMAVKLIKNEAELQEYLSRVPLDVIAQQLHEGPFEAGIFYVRMPGQQRGKIFSITDKIFPVIVGNGIQTVRELILNHPRYRLQAPVFLQRHEKNAHEILAVGQELRLSFAGNHCQGTLFQDGTHLWSETLEAKIDELARNFRGGFDFGRFDLRYESPELLRKGEGFLILELNGATSESTNLYDPSWSVFRAWKVLFAQWNALFAIGAFNRSRNAVNPTALELLRVLYAYYTHSDRSQVPSLAD